MPPSPGKKTAHKSSGKIFRQKEKSSSSTSDGFTSIRKDEVVDIKECPLTLPDVTPLDPSKSLPRYNRLACGEGMSLEEVDALQLELELLLSSVLVRKISLNNQLSVISQLEKGKLPPKQAASPGKRLQENESDRPLKKLKDVKADPSAILGPPPSNKAQKVKCSVVKHEPLFDVPDIGPVEMTKISPIKNDISNRFWQMVDTYCQEITADNVKLIEEFLNNQKDEEEYLKIPPLGRHFTLRWAQDDSADEQKEMNNKNVDDKKRIKMESGTDYDKSLKEVDLNGCNDDVAPMGPLTQRIISGLVEENSLSGENIENKIDALSISRPGFLKNLGLSNASNLEKRIKRELQEQGVLDLDGIEDDDDDDEILSELKHCQAELKGVTSHNRSHLNRLLKQSREALVRHDLKKKLLDADAKVLETYRALSSNKIKKKPLQKKDKESALKVLKDREEIVWHLDLVNSSLG